MKIFIRLSMVLCLLAVLAYGSYAFGRYVLTNKLFGPENKTSALHTTSKSTSKAKAVTRQAKWKGKKPRVDVRVLPAGQSSDVRLPRYVDEDGFTKSDEPPVARHSGDVVDSDGAQTINGQRVFDNAVDEQPDTNSSSRRRRRRRKAEPKPTPTPAASTEVVDGDDAVRVLNADDNDDSSKPASSRPLLKKRDDDSSDSSISSSKSTKKSSKKSTRRTRDRKSDKTDASKKSIRRESPVPKPEGMSSGKSSSSGGDSATISPVPKPE